MPPLFDLAGTAGDAHTWVAIIADSAIKGTVILALAGVFAVGCRRAPASVRHLAWALAVVGLCVLPALSVIVPRWGLPVLPPSVVGETAPSPTRAAARPDPFRAEVDPERILLARDGQVAATVTADPEAVNNGTAERSATRRWTSWVLFLWAGGVSIVAARVLVSLVAAGHKGRRAAAITDGPWAAIVAEIAARYGIRRRVSLRVTSGGTIPATWGLRRPVVLLPVEAMDWPQDRLRAVLSHELAHVARGDFLVQTVARFACALYWFNPLVWLAERRLRAECEQASDDLVLGAGLTPSDYATHLVEVLLAARRGREAPLGALAMGRRNGLEDRLRAILDGERSRCRLSSRRVALTTLAAGCTVLPLGFVRLEARAHDAPRLERLPKGMTVEVVGVSTHPSGPATWWGPDGTPLAEAPCDPPLEAVDSPGKEVREIVARIKGLPEKATVNWYSTQSYSRRIPAPQKAGVPVPGLERVLAEFPKGTASCDLHFDLALGAWTTERGHGGGKSIGIQKDDRAFFFGKARETRQGTAITVAHNITDRDVRVVAIDRDGQERLPNSSSSGGAGHLMGLDAEFDLPPGQIREYRLQSRPVGRFEIKNVALQPRKGGA
jgi:beta-lactamase regulating signal transducer with metallopeptidase domain